MQKPIPGYEELYSVDESGNVFSLRYGKMLKPNILQTGYLQYSLQKHGKRKLFLGHRLVAMTFIPNPCNYPILNHKDENKRNNSVSNLEWCTHKYNCNYGTLPDRISKRVTGIDNNQGGKATRKPCEQLSKEENHIAFYESVSDAHRKTGINLANIALCCNGQRFTAGNYKWRFIKEEKDGKTRKL